VLCDVTDLLQADMSAQQMCIPQQLPQLTGLQGPAVAAVGVSIRQGADTGTAEQYIRIACKQWQAKAHGIIVRHAAAACSTVSACTALELCG
jgi:hypothetical protein